MTECANHTSSLSWRMRSSKELDQAGVCESNATLLVPHLVRSQTGVCRVRLDWLWARWPGTPAEVYNPGTQAESTQVNVTGDDHSSGAPLQEVTKSLSCNVTHSCGGRHVGYYWHFTVVAGCHFPVPSLSVTLLFATVGYYCYLQLLLLATHCQGFFIIFMLILFILKKHSSR